MKTEEDICTICICVMCTEQCNLRHKAAKHTGRSLDTIQCSVRTKWFHIGSPPHRLCVGLKKDATVGIWRCPSCLQIPMQFYTSYLLLFKFSLFFKIEALKLLNMMGVYILLMLYFYFGFSFS